MSAHRWPITTLEHNGYRRREDGLYEAQRRFAEDRAVGTDSGHDEARVTLVRDKTRRLVEAVQKRRKRVDLGRKVGLESGRQR